MKDKTLLTVALLSALNFQLSTAFAQGTAFTYQGRLSDNGSPANGTNYGMLFHLYGAATNGGSLGNLGIVSVAVSNGLFTVPLDFGASVFDGNPRWLEISVQKDGGAFTTLSPRQLITPTPYAVFAGCVGIGGLTAGTYGNAVTFNNAANNFSGSFTGNGAGLTGVNAATLGGLSSSNFWKLGGNAGANPTNGNFIGTTDNLPLELRVNGFRALRFEPTINDASHSNIVNVIGGSQNNFVSSGVVGATIAGGGAAYYFVSKYTNSVSGDFGTVGGGAQNTAGAYVATVGGGYQNTAGSNILGSAATVSGGYQNTASSSSATVSGGYLNTASGSEATVGGGRDNIASGLAAKVSGGYLNTASSYYATVSGGRLNTASGDYSFAAGLRAKANHNGTFVWADSQGIDHASTSSNQFLIRAEGGVGINNNSPQAPLHVTGGGDAGLSAGGNFISGLVSGQNIVIDNNEIISRNNGAASDLILNFGSGNVGIGRNPAANRLEVAGEASKTTAGNWLANSDARIKTGVQTVTNALDKLSRVRLVQFRYTDEYRAAHSDVEDREYLNVVAQEFQKVFPENVKRSGEKLANGDDILQVDTYPLTIYSAAAVQELNAKLEEKSTRIGALEKELSELKAAVKKVSDKKD